MGVTALEVFLETVRIEPLRPKKKKKKKKEEIRFWSLVEAPPKATPHWYDYFLQSMKVGPTSMVTDDCLRAREEWRKNGRKDPCPTWEYEDTNIVEFSTTKGSVQRLKLEQLDDFIEGLEEWWKEAGEVGVLLTSPNNRISFRLQNGKGSQRSYLPCSYTQFYTFIHRLKQLQTRLSYSDVKQLLSKRLEEYSDQKSFRVPPF